MKRLATLLILVSMYGCCTLGQIPTQYFFLNDSCEFALPDYTQVIQVQDNCAVKHVWQTPNSGTLLTAGDDIQVKITAEDYFGNRASIQFDIVTIDELPPEFIILDSTVLIPSGHYQNDVRTWHFWTLVKDSTDLDLYYTTEK